MTRIATLASNCVLLLTFGACGWGDTMPALPQPAWATFRAEFTSTGGTTETRGRFYRRRDGSIRKETLGADGAAEFVTIQNRPSMRFYSFSDGSWSSQPLQLATRLTMPPTGADFPSAMPQPERVVGYRVVRTDTALGTVLLRAPALNYFPLVEDHPFPSLRVEFVSVTEGDVDAALFEPPAGAPVASLPWPYMAR